VPVWWWWCLCEIGNDDQLKEGSYRWLSLARSPMLLCRQGKAPIIFISPHEPEYDRHRFSRRMRDARVGRVGVTIQCVTMKEKPDTPSNRDPCGVGQKKRRRGHVTILGSHLTPSGTPPRLPIIGYLLIVLIPVLGPHSLCHGEMRTFETTTVPSCAFRPQPMKFFMWKTATAPGSRGGL